MGPRGQPAGVKASRQICSSGHRVRISSCSTHISRQRTCIELYSKVILDVNFFNEVTLMKLGCDKVPQSRGTSEQIRHWTLEGSRRESRGRGAKMKKKARKSLKAEVKDVNFEVLVITP
jgi:hypothetical protein